MRSNRGFGISRVFVFAWPCQGSLVAGLMHRGGGEVVGGYPDGLGGAEGDAG